MLESTCIVIAVLFSSYIILIAHKKKQNLSCAVGKMISMTNAMMPSVTIGTILGILFREVDLALPTMFSIIIGIIFGYFTGRPLSQMAALEGITAGIMGGMMGAMLGIMLQETYISMMIYFLDLVYVFVMILLLKVIEKEITKFNSEKKPFKTANYID